MNPNKELVEAKEKIAKLEAKTDKLHKAGFVSLACNTIAFVLITIMYVVL